MLFNILALVALLLALALMKRIVCILPMVVTCLFRWKENINIDTSLRLRTERDLAASAMLLPFCLLATKFGLYCPDVISDMSQNATLGITLAVFVGYLLLRASLIAAVRPKRMSSGIYHAATSTEHTYFIILTAVLLVIGGTMSVAGATPHSIKVAMFWLSGSIYTLFLARKLQIFASSCNLFMSFLYLCALEILPTGVLIASAVIF